MSKTIPIRNHPFPFDPSYGYELEALLTVDAPEGPADFSEFWNHRYREALAIDPEPELVETGIARRGWKIATFSYRSTEIEGAPHRIRGWALVPESGEVDELIVVLHGYGGREAPDLHLPLSPNAAILFPCLTGISQSAVPGIPSDPAGHVVQGIHSPDTYVMGNCVEDVWLAVSAGLACWPKAEGRVGLMGISFGGGIGAMALPWDARIRRAHFNVPTFGNQPLRHTLPTVGSGDSVTRLRKQSGRAAELDDTLYYFDAATAAHYISVPVHCACALFDPAVAPPGQFAIYNAIPDSLRSLFVLTAGHWEYAGIGHEHQSLLREIHDFFHDW